MHGFFHAGESGVTATGQFFGFLGHGCGLAHGFDELLRGGRDFAGRRANLGRGGGDFTGGGLLFTGSRCDLGDRSVHLHARALHLADQDDQVSDQP